MGKTTYCLRPADGTYVNQFLQKNGKLIYKPKNLNCVSSGKVLVCLTKKAIVVSSQFILNSLSDNKNLSAEKWYLISKKLFKANSVPV